MVCYSDTGTIGTICATTTRFYYFRHITDALDRQIVRQLIHTESTTDAK